MVLNCVAGEDSWESLGQQGDLLGLIDLISTLNTHWKDWCWSSKTLTTWHEEPIHWKRLRGQDERGNRGQGWMASLTQWTWVWAKYRRWSRTAKPGVLQFMGSQGVGHDLMTQQQYLMPFNIYFYFFIYLVVLDLSCSMQDLWSSLWHSESIV